LPTTTRIDRQRPQDSGQKIKDPAELPWARVASRRCGRKHRLFTARAKDGKPGYDTHLKAHQKGGAQRLRRKTRRSDLRALGVNDDKLTASMKCVSNASCTRTVWRGAKCCTKSSASKRADDHVHAYTNDQRVQTCLMPMLYRPAPHRRTSFPRRRALRRRGFGDSRFEGKLTGISLRVPVSTGSVSILRR